MSSEYCGPNEVSRQIIYDPVTAPPMSDLVPKNSPDIAERERWEGCSDNILVRLAREHLSQRIDMTHLISAGERAQRNTLVPR